MYEISQNSWINVYTLNHNCYLFSCVQLIFDGKYCKINVEIELQLLADGIRRTDALWNIVVPQSKEFSAISASEEGEQVTLHWRQKHLKWHLEIRLHMSIRLLVVFSGK